MSKKINIFLKILVSVILLSLLVYKIGLKKLIDTLLKIDSRFLWIVLSFYLILFVLGAINLKILFDSLVRIKLKDMFRYYVLSWAVGLVTPGKIGDYSIAYFLKKKINLGKSIAITTIDKIITVVVLFIMSIFGFFIFLEYYDAIKIMLIIIVLLCVLGGVLFSKKIKDFVKKYLLKDKAKMFTGFSKTLNLFVRRKKKILLINFILTLFKWILASVISYYLIISFGIQTEFLILIPITAMTLIISLVPISLSGLGVKELTAVYLYGLVGIDASIAMGVHVLILCFNYGFALLFSLAYKIRE